MLFQSVQPFGIVDLAAEDESAFFRGGAELQVLHIGGISHVGLRFLAPDRGDSSCESSEAVVIVVHVEHVDRPGVVVLHGCIYGSETSAEHVGLGLSLQSPAIHIAPVFHEDLAEILHGLPLSVGDHLSDSVPVLSGSVAEHTETRIAAGLVDGQTCGDGVHDILADVSCKIVLFVILVKGGDDLNAAVDHVGKVGEGIPEETADTDRNIDPGSSQFR